MTVVAVEINDVGLTAAVDSGPVGAPSPGFILTDRGDLEVGEPARAAARLKPRFVSHRSWDLLSQGLVGRPFPHRLSHADLVHAHLSRYWRDLLPSLPTTVSEPSVLLAVPGSYSVDQLSLLLGIARAGDMPVTGLVDASLVAVGDNARSDTTLVLDVHLHRAIWTVIEASDRLVRKSVHSVDAAGLLRFQNGWVRLIAERFVRETRFDPLHRGASEQELFDRLPAWTQRVADSGSAILSLDAGSTPRSVEITRREWIAATEAALDAVVATAKILFETHESAAIALSSRAARIVGLPRALAQLNGTEPTLLPEAAAARGALRHRNLIATEGAELPLILDLSAREPNG